MRCDQDCPEACAVLALVQMTVLQRRRQHKQSYRTQDWIQNMTDNNRTAPVYYLFDLFTSSIVSMFADCLKSACSTLRRQD